MPRRKLHFSLRKNEIYDRRGSRTLSELWGRGVDGPANEVSSLEYTHYCRKMVDPTGEDASYLYQDMFMPKLRK